MNRWSASWRCALRIARRQVLRNKSRNTLIVAMLALPVFGAVAVDTVLSSALHLSPAEQVTRRVGGFEAFIEPSQDTAIYQSLSVPPEVVPAQMSPQGVAITQGTTPDPAQSKTAGSSSSLAAVRLLLPQATLVPEVSSGNVYLDARNSDANGAYWRVDLGNPATAGVFDLVSGRVPQTAQEIDLSPAMAAGLGVQVGQPVTLDGGSAVGGKAAQFTVVGLVELPDSTQSLDAFALPTAPAATGQATDGWFVSGAGGVSWSQVQDLNRLGYPVISREAVLDPPPAAQVPFETRIPWFGSPYLAVDLSAAAVPAAVFAIVLGVGLLEVVLLAGPAFAVSARRREREFAMLGAAGADGRQLRRIVLADGVVLGAIAGVLGVGLGFGAAGAFLPFVGRITGQLPGAVHVSALQTGGIALLAVLLGLCSALFPARAVARREIMATLAGRRTEATRKRRVAGVCWGVALAALGLVGEGFGSKISPSDASVLVTAGIALIEVGAIMCTSAIVSAVASLGRILPLGPRLALREGARHAGRTTPAVAAMFAAVAGAVAAGAWLDSSVAQERAQYTPLLLPNQVAVQASPRQVPTIISALKSVLPDVTGTVTAESVPGYQEWVSAPKQWTVSMLTPGHAPPCAANGVTKIPVSALGTVGCGDYVNPTAIVGELIGGPQTLQQVTGIDDAAADRVLEQGGVVVTTPGEVRDGSITFVVQYDAVAPHAAEATQKTATYTLPAAYLDAQGRPDPGFVMSPAAAGRLGLEVPAYEQTTLIVDLAQPITARQLLQADNLIQREHLGGSVQNDSGLKEEGSLVNLIVLAFTILLAIGAAAIATGLALADGRADHETLTAVGGSPWTRRWLAGSTALVITGLGILIGVPIGFVIAAGLVRVNDFGAAFGGYSTEVARDMPFTVPWLNLGAMALAVPLVTAAGAMLLSRAKAPQGRRLG